MTVYVMDIVLHLGNEPDFTTAEVSIVCTAHISTHCVPEVLFVSRVAIVLF